MDGVVQCDFLMAQLAAHLWAAGTVTAEKAAATRAHPAHPRLWAAGTVAATCPYPVLLRLWAAGTVAVEKATAEARRARFRRLQPPRSKMRCLVASP